MRKLAGVLVFLLVANCHAGDKVLKSEDETEMLAEKVMASVVAGKYLEAFDTLKPYWPMPESEVDALATKSVQARNTAESRFGKSVDYKFANKKFAADCLFCLNYLERCEHTALVWQFIFYKVGAGWHVNIVRWNDNVSLVFGP